MACLLIKPMLYVSRFLAGASASTEDDNVRHLPKAISEPGLHPWRDPHRPVRSDETIIHVVERHGEGMVLDRLAESVREPAWV